MFSFFEGCCDEICQKRTSMFLYCMDTSLWELLWAYMTRYCTARGHKVGCCTLSDSCLSFLSRVQSGNPNASQHSPTTLVDGFRQISLTHRRALSA